MDFGKLMVFGCCIVLLLFDVCFVVGCVYYNFGC